MTEHLISKWVFLFSWGILPLFAILVLIIFYYRRSLAAERKRCAEILKEHKALINLMIPMVEKERERIAKNVHDDIGSILGIIRLNFSKVLKNQLEKRPSEDLIKDSLLLVDESIKNTRGICHDLMPASLIRLGFEKALVEYCRQIGESQQLGIRVNLDKEEVVLGSMFELQLFRIVQEILNNIIKHAEASELELTISEPASLVLGITIAHNGTGITHEKMESLSKTEDGIGLRSILSRVELMNGSIMYSSSPTEESSINIRIPIAYEEIS
ncbi:MAG: two-component sensor histidine kinase [Bacteroidetes bacterium]|jgi:two-component system NarL family sensor kinase|nr:two-component sensor histidine kinase [Bacteroidota bacterium]